MDDYQPVTIKQNRGPMLEFEGRLLASDTFEVRRDGTKLTMEIWETRGGALIAVTRGEAMQGGEVRDIVEAKVVERARFPLTLGSQDRVEVRYGSDGLYINGELVTETVNRQAMHFAVLDHFDWSDRARSMVRKTLKWSLKMRVA